MTMSIATAIHTKRIVGTAMKYCPVPSCYSIEECRVPYIEPEYVTCPTCEGRCEDGDGDECYRCDGEGQILNPKRLKSPKQLKKKNTW